MIKKTLGHAYLFSGPRGVGKTSLARIIASQLGCDPIFDISEIDAASHNKVDDIREMNESVNFIASSPGKKRVFILDEVHMLSNAASNAFLKTLEEPPEHIIFILATTEPERVLETIKSRTTQIVFKKITEDEIIKTLKKIGKKEKIDLDVEIIKMIANSSDGSLRDAINLFEQTHNTFGEEASIDDLFSLLGKLSSKDFEIIINAVETQDTGAILTVIRGAYAKGLQPNDIVESISEFFRNLFYLKYLPDDNKLSSLTPNLKQLLEQANNKISAKQLVRILDLIDEINTLISTTSSAHLKLELFMMKIIKPELGSDVKSIGYRVDLLEGKLITEVKPKKDEKHAPEVEEEKTEVEKPKKNIKRKNKESLENFDVYWPKILEELREKLSSRKFSYITAVRPEVESNGTLNLFVDKDNEFLLKELEKSEEVIDLVISEVAEKMGIEVNIKISISEESKLGESKGLDAAQEVFDVEDLN
ncbi:MAG: DNA polymerase III subunit gamma/tau [Candidatus Actinomarina sp.]